MSPAGEGAVCRGWGIRVIIRMPKKTSAIGRFVRCGVVNIDNDYMANKVANQLKPARVPTSGKVQPKSIGPVILVVIMGDHGRWARIIHGFMIGVEVPKMTPAVFVDAFAFFKEARLAIDSAMNQ